MTAEALNNVEQLLCRAVAEGRYEDVEHLVSSYCDSALAHLATLKPGDARIPEIGSHVQEVLSWANLVLITARSVIAAPLTSLPLVSRYLAIPHTPPRTRLKA